MVRAVTQNKREWLLGVVVVATLLLGLVCWVPTAKAGEARYIYDDLGRLHQVIDENGDVATYTYDSVGNILSITRSTGGVSAPSIGGITPGSGNAGQTVAVTISGTSLAGASVSTDNPGITVGGVHTTATSISASFGIAYGASTGAATVTVTTSIGSATTTFTVNASAPVISTLQPGHGPVSRLVRINGLGFGSVPSGVSVTFGGVAATVVNVTPTAIDTQVPVGATGGGAGICPPLSGSPTPLVVTVNGLPSLAGTFCMQSAAGAPPTVTSITPMGGSEQGGEKIRIRGTGFTTVPEVSLGDYHVVKTSFYGAPHTVTDSSQPRLSVTSSGGSSGGGSTGATSSSSVVAPINYKFLGIPVGNLTVIDDTTMDAIVPPGPIGLAHLLVSNANGDAIALNAFTFLAGPPERIVGLTPLPGLINVPTNTPITVRFSRAVDRATITTTSFSLRLTSSGAAVGGTFSYSDGDTLVVFRPTSALAGNSQYTASFTQAIASADGLPLSGAYSGSFTTGGSADVTSPTVTVSPANGATDVPFNTTITFSFSEAIDPYTFPLSALQVVNQGETRNGTLFFSGQNSVVTFVAASPFFPTTPVTVRLSGTITDVAGNRLVGGSGVGTDVVTSFTTASVADVFPPQILQVNPVPGATGINTNTSISVTFNESLSPSSVNTSTVLLSSGGAAIPGTIALSNFNSVVTFLPASSLPGLSPITITLTSGITDVGGNATVAPFTSTFTTQSAVDNFRPSVIKTNPPAGQTGVSLDVRATIVFDERVNPATVTSSSFRLVGPSGVLPGIVTVSADQRSATFTAGQALLPNTAYSVSYTSAIQDIAGNQLFNPANVAFTTGIAPQDMTPPVVLAISPVTAAQGVPVNTNILVQFSEAVSPTSVNQDTVILATSGTPIPIDVTFEQSNTVLRIKSANLVPLLPSTFYELTVTPGVTDITGNPLPAAVTTSFTTGPGSDSTVPAVTSRSPAANATSVARDTVVVVTFSEAINPITVTATTVRLTGGGVTNPSGSATIPASYSVSADRRTVTMTPSFPLFANRTYTLSFSNVEDVAGNLLGSSTSNFTTAVAAGTIVTALPTAATVVANPTTLFADGITTTTVTISNINRSGVLVPNGTVVAVTAEPAYRLDSAGGTILNGTVSSADNRFRLVTTLGGSVTLTYQSPNRPDLTGTVQGIVQVASVDAAGAPISVLGTDIVTVRRSQTATISTNPTSLLAASTSVAAVRVVVTDASGNPVPAGTVIGITAEPVYELTSLGGAIIGGTPLPDTRFTGFTTITGGTVDLTYTPPTLAAGQTGSTYIQVVAVDGAGQVVKRLSAANSGRISLSGSTGNTAPQPEVLAVSPANGQSGVGTNAVVMAQFSQSLDPATVTASTFSVSSLAGTRTLSASDRGPNTVVTFTPSAPLAPNTSRTITISTGIRSATGNPLLAASSTTFSTGTGTDTSGPTVVQSNPPNGATGVPTNVAVSVEVSEPINAVTATATTVTLTAGGNPVSGRLSVGAGVRGPATLVTLTPDALLTADTTYTITVGAGVSDPAGNPLTSAYTATFTTAGGIDNLQPTVISLSPGSAFSQNPQRDVPLNAVVSIRFSEPINPLTITSATVRLNGSLGQLTGTYALSADGLTATFVPGQPLLPNESYTLSATSGIQDLAGNAAVNTVTGYFRTAVVGDTTGPEVLAISPVDGATGVATNAGVLLQFSESVAPPSVTNQTVLVGQGGTLIAGELTLEQSQTVARWIPANLVQLAAGTTFTVTVTTGVTDLAGNTLSASVIGRFTTGTGPDTAVPTVTSRSPVNNATNVPRTTLVVVTFSEAINPITVTETTFRLTGGGVSGGTAVIPGSYSVSPDRTTVTFMPSFPLFANQTYNVSVSNVEDLAGNKLTSSPSSFRVAVATGTDLNALPTAATGVANPTTLFADGLTTTTVTISNINRSGVLVANGTVVAVTAEPAYRLDSGGGTILNGSVSSADNRFRLFSTLGGRITLTYQSPNRPELVGSQSLQGIIQVASVDVAEAPINVLGTETVTLRRSQTATITTNPTSLLAAGTSTAAVRVLVTTASGDPVPAGVVIGVTAAPVYELASLGGTIIGGTALPDARFRGFTTITGGFVDLTYTPPTLAPGQSGSAYIQVAAVDGAGQIIGRLGLVGSGRITLSGSTGNTAPQPEVLAVSPAHGQSGVGTNAVVQAQFSQSLDPATVTASTFSVSSLAGTRTLSASDRGPNTVVTFTPTAPLAPNTSRTITISTGIRSATGNPLLAASSTTFSTGTGTDTSGPTVVQSNPPNGATGVPTNVAVSVEVSEPINAVTATATTVTLTVGDNPVTGRLSVGAGVRGPATVVAFTPDQLLVANTTYVLTLTSGLTDPAGNALTPFTASFTTSPAFDNFQPSVVSMSPGSTTFQNPQKNVPLNTLAVVRFSEPISPITINTATLSLNGPLGPVTGTYTVGADGLTATLAPSQPLLPNAGYSISPSVGIQDLAGNALINPGASFFTTAVGSDIIAPQLLVVSPADGATGVALNAGVLLQFSESLATTSVTNQNVVISHGGIAVEGEFTLEQNQTVVRWKPANLVQLAAGTVYTVTVMTGVADLAGHALPTAVATTFTTGAGTDTAVPTVTSRSPAANATNVARDTAVVVTFSEVINPITVTATTVRLTGGGVTNPTGSATIPASYSVSADRRTVTMIPSFPLFANRTYTLSLSNVEDVAGNLLGSSTSSFTTAVAAGTIVTALPTAATVVANPTTLFADGLTTTTVTISSINRSGVLVADGTVVAVTAEPAYRLDSGGGTILNGSVSSADNRFRLFSTLGGRITLTYQSPNRPELVGSQSLQGIIQVASVDVAEAPINVLGTETVTLRRSQTATITTNPTSLLAAGTSTAAVRVLVTTASGDPVPAGVVIGVTAEPVYELSSLGGTIVGGTLLPDNRFRAFMTITGGVVEFTYTPPTLAVGQSGSAYIQVAAVDGAGQIIGRLGVANSGRITLSGSTGNTAPQPEVLAVSPANGQSGVGTNTVVQAQFSQSLDPATVTASTINVSSLAGTRTLSASDRGPNTVVTFTPTVPLAPNTSRTITISTGITSATGNPLLAASSTTFSVGVTADTTSPSVVQSNPPNGSTGVPTNTVVSVEVSEPINAVTATTVTLAAGGAPVNARLTVGSGVRGPASVVTLTPDALLNANTTYTITVGSGVSDPAGNPLTSVYSASFTTAGGIDNFHPSVVSASPAAGSVDVPSNIAPVVTFSETMNPVSVNTDTVYLTGAGNRVPATLVLGTNGTVATVTPTIPLFAGTIYSMTVANGVQDVAGNSLTNAGSTSFTTALAPGTANLPTAATVTANPPSLFANGQLATTVIISNITRAGVQVPNGTLIAVTADPAFVPTSVGGTISGSSVGTSVDGRFLLFSTLGAQVTVSYTPPNLTGLRAATTASGTIQVAAVDLDTRPVTMIGQQSVTLFRIQTVTFTATPSTLPANGTSTSALTVTIRDQTGSLVPDGTLVGVTAAPIFSPTSAGGTILGGTTSVGDSRVQLFTAAGGQITTVYQAPAAPGSGTASIQVVTVDAGGYPTSLAGSTPITLQ